MTGLKYHRVTSLSSSCKAAYDPAEASAQAERHAASFMTLLAERSTAGWPVVVAYDAELFGHWWLEGPIFIEQLLRRLDGSQELRAVTLSASVAALPTLPISRPAISSWGSGGYHHGWLGPRNAWVWRHIHHAHHEVVRMVRRTASRDGACARARDEAVRELLLLEASDWPFLIGTGSAPHYAARRVQRHHHRALAFARVALGVSAVPPDDRTAFLDGLEGEALWSPLV